MPSLREYFLTESADYLDRLETLANADDADAPELLRTARALRGSAQMAREERVRKLAATIETVARQLESGARPWDADTRERLTATLAEAREIARVGEDDPAGAARADAALARWAEVGVSAGEEAEPQAQGAAADQETRAFVETEVRGVIEELERALPALTREPMGREPLKALLRRQRTVLGSAALARFPIVSEALHAVEDATRVVARKNLAVDDAWLALYREALDVLRDAVGRIRAGETTSPESPAVRELRSLRERLIGDAGAAQPAPAPPPSPEGAEPVEVLAFFKTESNKLLDRIERMAGAFAAATEERRTHLRAELRSALNALRDTSRTFGFERPARQAEQALERVTDGAATMLLDLLEQLREAVQNVGAAEPEEHPVPGETAEQPHAAAAAEPAVAAAAAAAPAPEPEAAAPDVIVPDADHGDVVPIEELLYRGDAALRRALELRERVEAPGGDADALAELFDLVELAMS